MTDKNAGLYTMTAPVVMVHPQLFEAKAIGPKGKESGTPKFSASFLLKSDSTDLAAMKALVSKLAKARWPGRNFQDPDSPVKFPFANGDKLADKRKAKTGKDDGDFNRGHVVMSARSKFEPKLSVLDGKQIIDLSSPELIAAHKNKFYFGTEVLATFNFVPYDGVGANPDGVTCYMNLIMSLNRGRKIATSTVSAADAFRGYIGAMSAEDPTSGSSDDELGI